MTKQTDVYTHLTGFLDGDCTRQMQTMLGETGEAFLVLNSGQMPFLALIAVGLDEDDCEDLSNVVSLFLKIKGYAS